ncbi:hypothetical protein LguiB_029224 [Lonicera macranthoides]
MDSFTSSKQPLSHGLAPIITIALLYLITTLATQSLATRVQPQVNNTNTQVIKKTCGVTLYPKLCFKSLSSYSVSIQTSPYELASAALSVTLKRAKTASDRLSTLSRRRNLGPREVGAIKDCLENMEDSVDELQKSIMAMVDLDGPEFEIKMGNVLTWVSAALTDEDTCMDGFKAQGISMEIKGIIRGFIVNVSHLTSNALAIINSLSST